MRDESSNILKEIWEEAAKRVEKALEEDISETFNGKEGEKVE